MADIGGSIRRGNTLTLILTLLEEEPMYGFQIAKEVERRTEGALTFGEGLLYPHAAPTRECTSSAEGREKAAARRAGGGSGGDWPQIRRKRTRPFPDLSGDCQVTGASLVRVQGALTSASEGAATTGEEDLARIWGVSVAVVEGASSPARLWRRAAVPQHQNIRSSGRRK